MYLCEWAQKSPPAERRGGCVQTCTGGPLFRAPSVPPGGGREGAPRGARHPPPVVTRPHLRSSGALRNIVWCIGEHCLVCWGPAHSRDQGRGARGARVETPAPPGWPRGCAVIVWWRKVMVPRRVYVMGVLASAHTTRSPMVRGTTPAPSSVGICTVVIREPAYGPAVSTWPGRGRVAVTAPSASGCTSSTVDSITRTSSGGKPRTGGGRAIVRYTSWWTCPRRP